MDSSEFPVDPELFRLAMRQWTTGVTVVTSQFAGIQHGMTVSSFTSISLVPPQVLISLEIGTRTEELVHQSGFFAVTILSSDQLNISERFAGRQSEHQNRFDGLATYSLQSGSPLLVGGLAGFDCAVISAHAASTHTIFIAEVMAARIGQGEDPLIYYNRSYHRLAG